MPSHMGNSNLLRAQTEQKGWRKVTSLHCELGHPSSALGHWCCWLLGLQTLGFTRTPPLDWELHHWLPLLFRSIDLDWLPWWLSW